MDTDEEAKPYLLTEAGNLTGLSPAALRKRIKRGTLRGSRSNADGLFRVWLRQADIEATREAVAAGRVDDVQETAGIRQLTAAVEAVREQAGLVLERERARADKAEAEAREARAEASAARERAAAAEGRLEGMRLALDAATRPIWRRWLGK